MFDPTTLPMAIPGAPASAAWIEATSSGTEVPNPTMMMPTTRLDRPRRRRKRRCTAHQKLTAGQQQNKPGQQSEKCCHEPLA